MKITHLLPILLPKHAASEALSQDIAALQQAYGGAVISLNPNARLPLPLPRLLFGFHLLRSLRQQAAATDLYHFWSPDLFAYPVLRWLPRPCVLSLTGSAGTRRPAAGYLRRFARVVVQDEATAAQLRTWGAEAAVVQPGVDLARFTCTPPPSCGDFHLLMASAPWTPAQFRTKGVDALLAAAQRNPRLRLTFLWRGVLAEEMARRVAAAGVQEQVQVIDAVVDVNQVLAGVHAAVVLAETGSIVKAYPHSLLDALAAGRPVMVSCAIPMADYVARTGCGVVVDAVTPEAVAAALATLMQEYAARQAAAGEVGRRDFSQQAMVAAMGAIYQEVLSTRRKAE